MRKKKRKRMSKPNLNQSRRPILRLTRARAPRSLQRRRSQKTQRQRRRPLSQPRKRQLRRRLLPRSHQQFPIRPQLKEINLTLPLSRPRLRKRRSQQPRRKRKLRRLILMRSETRVSLSRRRTRRESISKLRLQAQLLRLLPTVPRLFKIHRNLRNLTSNLQRLDPTQRIRLEREDSQLT